MKAFFRVCVFVFGCIAVVTGPVALIYPEKIRNMFASIENEMTPRGIRAMMLTEALLRIALGIFFFTVVHV
jgi:NhaP-type Na+/H+ or K+/H+ antiporter